MKKQKGLGKGEVAQFKRKVCDLSAASCDRFGLWTPKQKRAVDQKSMIRVLSALNDSRKLSSDDIQAICDKVAEEVMAAYWAEVKTWANRKAYRRHRNQIADREDAQQEAMLRALEHNREGGKPLKPQKAGDRAMNDFRKQDRRGKAGSLDNHSSGTGHEPVDADPGSSPQRDVLVEESRQRLRPLLLAVPGRIRTWLATWRVYQAVARKKGEVDPQQVDDAVTTFSEILLVSSPRVLRIYNLLAKEDAMCKDAKERKLLKDRRKHKINRLRNSPAVEPLLKYLKSYA